MLCFDWFSGIISTNQDTLAQWIVAVFGIVATLVSLIAVVLVRDTLKATRDTLEETRKIGVAENPPRLDVEQVCLPIVANKELEGQCQIINRGPHRARVRNDAEKTDIRSQVLICWGYKLPQEHIVRSEFGKKFRTTLEYKKDWINPGDLFTWKFTSNGKKINTREIKKIRDGEMKLYVVGLIRYGDDLDLGNGNHRTLFCRCYNPRKDRFEPVNDRYYEYQT